MKGFKLLLHSPFQDFSCRKGGLQQPNAATLRGSSASIQASAELVERGFVLILDRGGMRRAWLRGRDNVQKRYLIHVAGYNPGLLMRLLTGAGTPREFIAMASARLSCDLAGCVLIVMIFVAAGNQCAASAVMIRPIPHGRVRDFSTGCYPRFCQSSARLASCYDNGGRGG